jgi:hypothetical protein
MTQETRYHGDSRGHNIQEVENEGGIIVLEDGSRWQVYAGFMDKTRKWQASEMITVNENRDDLYPYRLINIHKNESVEVRLV